MKTGIELIAEIFAADVTKLKPVWLTVCKMPIDHKQILPCLWSRKKRSWRPSKKVTKLLKYDASS